MKSKFNNEAQRKVRELMWEAESGSVDGVKKLLSQGVDVNSRKLSKTNAGETPLMAAARGGRIDIMEFLIKEGARVNACAKLNPLEWLNAPYHSRSDKNTALHIAAHFNKKEAVQLLLDHGAQIDKKDKYGMTPLMCAAQMGAHFSHETGGTVALLVEKGADLFATNKDGETALDCARKSSYPDAAQIAFFEKKMAEKASRRVSRKGQGPQV